MSDRHGENGARVRVDAASRSPLRRIWRYVGYDEPNYTYTPNGRELLAKLGAMSDAPYFIRCHFLLCSGDGTARLKWGSTNAYSEDDEGNPRYFFEIVDRVLDAQIENGCIPFVEIGFMPEALSTAPPDVPYDDVGGGGWAYPPSDYERWADLIREFARHCVERYGLREVDRWYWELWNEPNVMYWKGSTEEFCRLYDYTQWALHSVLPGALLGGPAIARPVEPGASEFLAAFLDHCVHGTNAITGETGTRLDLVTFHVKGGRILTREDAPKQTPTIQHLIDNVEQGLNVVARFPELKGLEVNLSECDPDGWAAGGRHDNPNLNFRNTEYYSSYVANTVCRLIDLRIDGPNRVDGMLTWAFQFEDREYFEGLRSLSTNGIDKAVLNVFRLLAKLGGARLAAATERTADSEADLSTLAAGDEDGGVQVFVSHHHDDWDVRDRCQVEITVEHLVPGMAYDVTQWLVDRDHGNAYTAWVEMGSPQSPTKEQETRLRRAAMLKPTKLPALVADPAGTAIVRSTIETHSACMIELSPVAE